MSAAILALWRRQTDSGAPDANAPDAAAPAGCQADEVDNDWAQLRIASIFIILVGSLIGALLPIWLARYRDNEKMGFSKMAFFVAKYFGSGVIVSTAFMHLMAPATDILGKVCLKPLLGDYDWAMAIVLMTVMAMFFIELLASWFENKKTGHSHDPIGASKKFDLERGSLGRISNSPNEGKTSNTEEVRTKAAADPASTPVLEPAPNNLSYPPGGGDHLGHGRNHTEGDSHIVYAGKMTSIIILEAGVVLHSVFIGLTLAVSSEFVVLFVVLVFHQTFEGLGLGARLVTFDWPADKRRWTPWVFAVLYGLTTPVAIAAGLGVKDALANNPTTRFMVEGISNAISGGILLYTGVVELLAHEFMFNPEMDRASLRYKLMAFGCMSLGAGLMALLAKWA